MNRTLERAGGSLANLVTMTVFINDARNGDRFVQIRREYFPDGCYPCSALLTIRLRPSRHHDRDPGRGGRLATTQTARFQRESHWGGGYK